jgi:integrase
MGPDLARHAAPATFSARMDAEHWLADERRLIERGDWTPPKLRVAQQHSRSQTLGEYADNWLEHRNLKPRTRQGYRELLDGPIAGLHGVPLALITPERVRTWHTGLGTATPRKREHAYQLLHAVLNTAVTDGRINVNPCVIRGAMSSPSQRQAVILTPDEVAKVATAITPANLKALVLVSAWCGLRWGEVTELRRKDVSDDCTAITVSRAVTHRAKQCDISTTKSSRVHTVIVPPHVVPDLADHMTHFVADDADALLFTAERTCHYNERTMRNHFADALKAVGISKRVRIHDLRHFHGTMTAQCGATLAENMARQGHSTVRASMIYQQTVDGADASVAAKLSALAEMAQKTG